MPPTRWAFVAISALLFAGCSCDDPPGSDGGTTRDGGTTPDAGPRPDGAAEDGGPCRGNEAFRFGVCVPDPASCAMGEECQNDSCCVDGECIPYTIGPCGDFDMMCERNETPGEFVPQLECEWMAPAGQTGVMATPVVGDFDFDGDPVTIRPSIAFINLSGNLFVIDGATCAQQFTDGSGFSSATPPAIGDLDGDGRPELVARAIDGVRAYRVDTASGTFVRMWTASSSSGGNVAIHDLDDDGVPEVYASGTVLDNVGNVRISAGSASSSRAVLADVDADGVVESVSNNGIYRPDFAGSQWIAEPYWAPVGSFGRAFWAVGDFGDFGDGPDAAEIVWVGNGQVTVTRITGQPVFGPVTLLGRPLGGPPTIADFDGDGEAEIGVAGSDTYAVYDFECLATPLPAACDSPGVRWQQQSQDFSSAQTGSSVFDFEGDGAAEAVYADECYLRVYDGATGVVKFSVARSSNTIYEYPVIADVDGDFNSEIVVGNNLISFPGNCPDAVDPLFTGPACDASTPCASPLHVCQGGACRAPRAGGQGIQVYGDLADLWVNSRPIWNQDDYHVTHVNDDGTIPRTSAWMRNWSVARLNNFRQNVQGILGNTVAADLTIRPNDGWDCSGSPDQTFAVSVCNRGQEPVSPGVPVTFYAEGASICMGSRTMGILRPGECEDVECMWSAAPSMPVDVTVVADDDAAGFGVTYRECREGNNTAVFGEDSCDLI
ncbi:MAG: FG-GAP repeat domain-containing protein [Sandaracinaceae bacterium]